MCKCDIGVRDCGQETVGCLSGGLVHDFNNLLTVVIGNVEFLAEALDGRPELRQAASQALTAAEQGAQLAQRLLMVAREQAPKTVLIEVWALLESVAPMVRRAVRGQIDIVTERGVTEAWVRADKAQLTSAVLNLCLNARDAMPKGGRIVLRVDRPGALEARGAEVLISVEDTGHGMAPEVMARIFDPFFTTKGRRHRPWPEHGAEVRANGERRGGGGLGRGRRHALRRASAGGRAGPAPRAACRGARRGQARATALRGDRGKGGRVAGASRPAACEPGL
jgi:signal transduction histidine kinase